MARLQIQRPNGTIDADGYIRFVEKLFELSPTNNFNDYVSMPGPGQKAAKLQQFAHDIGYVIRQWHPNLPGNNEDIGQQNCHVQGDRDRLRGAGSPSSVTVPLPHARPVDATGNLSFSYLKDHLVRIFRLCEAARMCAYPNDETEWDAAAVERACKYLFGVMMLTRCR